MTLSRLPGSRVMTQMDRDDERLLVARFSAGDVDAFDELYEAYRPRVFAFLLRMSRSRTVADDSFARRGRRVPDVRRTAPPHCGDRDTDRQQ